MRCSLGNPRLSLQRNHHNMQGRKAGTQRGFEAWVGCEGLSLWGVQFVRSLVCEGSSVLGGPVFEEV